MISAQTWDWTAAAEEASRAVGKAYADAAMASFHHCYGLYGPSWTGTLLDAARETAKELETESRNYRYMASIAMAPA